MGETSMSLDLLFDKKDAEYYSYKDNQYLESSIGTKLVDFYAIDLDYWKKYIEEKFQKRAKDINELNERFISIINSFIELHIYFSAYAEKLYYDYELEINTYKANVISLEMFESDSKKDLESCIADMYEAQSITEKYLSIFDDEVDKRPFKTKYKDLYSQNPKLFNIEVSPSILYTHMNGTLFEIFRFKNGFIQYTMYYLCMFELIQLIMYNLRADDFRLKRCDYCNKFFIKKGKYKTSYCDRKVPGSNRTCKQIGAQETYRESHKNNDIIKIYNKEYNTRYRRVHDYGFLDEDEFKNWQKEAKKLKKQALTDDWGKEKFIKELNKITKKGE
jgi:hypothetical protein